MQFDGSKFLVPTGKLKASLDGDYQLEVELVDSKGKTTKEKMDIVVNCKETFVGVVSEDVEELIEDFEEIFERKEGTEPNPRITKFNGMGELEITFDIPMNAFDFGEI